MMSEHETAALGHARILEFHKFFSEYTLWLQSGIERFRVKIRIYETNDGRFFFVQSHFVRTPAFEGGAVVTQLTPRHRAPGPVDPPPIRSRPSTRRASPRAMSRTHGWFIPNDLF